MEVFDNEHWGMTKKLCTLVGAWPFKPAYQRKILQIYFHFIIQSIYTVEVFKLVEVRGKLVETLDCFPVFVYHSIMQVKIKNMYTNINKVKELLLTVKSDWESNLEQSELQLLQDDNRFYKILMQLYFLGGASISVMYIFGPMVPIVFDIIMPLENITRPRILPFPTQYYIDPEKYFTPLYIHQLIVNFSLLTALFAFMSLYSGFVQHACAMFTIIGNRLKNLTADNNQNGNGFESLVICIKMHKDLLQFTKLMEEHYTNYLLFIIGIIVLMLSATGFQFVVMENDAFEKIRILWYATGQVSHLFCFSYLGETLIKHSEAFNASLCASNWYEFPQNMKVLFIIMLMKSKTISALTAGKIYVMSCENFSVVMKSTFSYFTVLTSAQ